jgi:hypothetical protein
MPWPMAPLCRYVFKENFVVGQKNDNITMMDSKFIILVKLLVYSKLTQ